MRSQVSGGTSSKFGSSDSNSYIVGNLENARGYTDSELRANDLFEFFVFSQ